MTTDTFKTKDTPLAAFLCLHFPLIECTKHDADPRSVYFIFTRTSELDERVKEFFLNEATVEPNSYYSHIHICRKLIAQTLNR